MSTKQIEALKLALDALELYYDLHEEEADLKAITAIREALAEQPAQQDEIEELTNQRDFLADILTRTANALKSQPAELSAHSWHDLPEVAQRLKAEQQQEPVAWMWKDGTVTTDPDRADGTWTSLYTSPQRKPLTDEEIENLWQNTAPYYDHQDFARSIEAAHGIKE